MLGAGPQGTLLLGAMDLGLDADHHALGDFLLHGKDIGHVALVALGPEMMAAGGVDELRRDPDTIAAATCAAFDEIGGAEILADLRRVLRLALVGEGRIARDHGKPAPVGQRGDDVLGEAIDEIFLGRIAAHVVEGQHRNSRPGGEGHGGLVGQGQRSIGGLRGRRDRRGLPICRVPSHPERLNGPFDVLERETPEVLERGLQPADDRIMDVPGNHDAACGGLRFQPRRHVHAIAIEIVAIDDQVAEVQSDPEHDGGVLGGGVLGLIPIGLGHRLLELNGRAQGVHGAGKLDQSAIAGQLDQPPTVACQHRLETLFAMFPQASERAALVPAHQPGVADHVHCHDGSQPALLSGQ